MNYKHIENSIAELRNIKNTILNSTILQPTAITPIVQ